MERELVAHKANKITVVQDLLDVINSMKQEDASVMGYEFFPVTMKNLQGYSCLHGFSNYKHFKIPKKSGGYREISAPRDKSFKAILQYLKEILESLYTPSDYAMGFTSGRSIVTNAENHVGKNYVFNIDLKDFFPSIERWRVASRLRLAPFEFSEEVANTIADLCCIRVGGENGVRYVLPQGAPTSPIITNMVCDRLDENLGKLAKWYRVEYTRYADDITFSSDHNVYRRNSAFRKQLKRIIEEQHFTINSAKTRLQKRGTRQEVTGVTVNERANVRRGYVRDIRNALYIWKRYGHSAAESRFTKKYRAEKGRVKAGTPSLVNVISGKLQYLKMLKGAEDGVYKKLQAEFENICSRNFRQIDKEALNNLDKEDLIKEINKLLNDSSVKQSDKAALKDLLDFIIEGETEAHLDNETNDDQLGNGSREVFNNRVKGRPLATTVAVDGITEYQIDGLKEGKAIPYNPEEDSNLSEKAKEQIKLIQGIKKELGIYDFVNSGNLAASNSGKPRELPIYYGVHEKDGKKFIVLYIKEKDAFSPTQLITTKDGEKYQAVGILTEPTKRYVVDDKEAEKDDVDANKEWYKNKRQEILDAQKNAGAEGQEHFVSDSFTYISFMYSGRLLSTKKEAWSGDEKSSRPLSEVRGFKKDRIGSRIVVWASTVKGGSKSGGSAFYAGNDQWYPGYNNNIVPFNRPQPDGSLWLLTDGADGNTYAKALRVEKYDPNRNPDSSIAKDIDACINILFDKNKNNYEKVEAKIKLQNDLLYFGKDNNILISPAGNISFTRKVYTDNTKTATTELKDKINSPKQLKEAIVRAGIRYQVKKANLGSRETVYRKANDDGQSYSEALLEAGVITTDLVAVQNVDASFEIYKDPNSKGSNEGTKKVEPEPTPGPTLGATPKLNEVGSVALNDSGNTVFIKDKDGNFYKRQGPEGTPLEKMTQIDEDEYNLAKKIQENGGIENGKLYYEDPVTGKTYYIFMDIGGSSDSLGPIIIAEKDKDSSNFTLSFHNGSPYQDDVVKRIVGALQKADERIKDEGDTMRMRGTELVPNKKGKAEIQAITKTLFTPDVFEKIKDCKTLADIADKFNGVFKACTPKEAKEIIESIKTCGK